MHAFDRLNPEILDVDLLQTWSALSRPGDENFLKELVQIFLRRAPELLETLNHAVLRKDSSAVAQAAHALKGTSSSMGAKLMAQICETIEFESADVIACGVSHPKVLELLGSFDQVKNELQPLAAAYSS